MYTYNESRLVWVLPLFSSFKLRFASDFFDLRLVIFQQADCRKAFYRRSQQRYFGGVKPSTLSS